MAIAVVWVFVIMWDEVEILISAIVVAPVPVSFTRKPPENTAGQDVHTKKTMATASQAGRELGAMVGPWLLKEKKNHRKTTLLCFNVT